MKPSRAIKQNLANHPVKKSLRKVKLRIAQLNKREMLIDKTSFK